MLLTVECIVSISSREVLLVYTMTAQYRPRPTSARISVHIFFLSFSYLSIYLLYLLYAVMTCVPTLSSCLLSVVSPWCVMARPPTGIIETALYNKRGYTAEE
jgi:hypothetical protein